MACIARESDGGSSIGLVAEVVWFSALNPPPASLGHLRCCYRVEQGRFRCCSMAVLESSFSVENIVSQNAFKTYNSQNILTEKLGSDASKYL